MDNGGNNSDPKLVGVDAPGEEKVELECIVPKYAEHLQAMRRDFLKMFPDLREDNIVGLMQGMMNHEAITGAAQFMKAPVQTMKIPDLRGR